MAAVGNEIIRTSACSTNFEQDLCVTVGISCERRNEEKQKNVRSSSFWSQKRRNSCNVSAVQPQKSASPPPLLPSTPSSRSMDISTWVWTSLCFSPLSPWRLESGQTCWRREKLLCFLTLKKGADFSLSLSSRRPAGCRLKTAV